MKKLAIILCAAVALFSMPQWAGALDTIQTVGAIDDPYGEYRYGSGGEFTLMPTGSVSNYYYVSGKTGDISQKGTFQTFCLEAHETIYAGQVNDYIVSTAARNGGVTAPVGLGADPISKGTAFLYSQFVKGILAGYNYSDPARSDFLGSSADLLQKAIWWLEGEDGGATNVYTALAISTFGTEGVAKSDANGLYNVYALNLYAQGHAGEGAYVRQDVLVVTPEPMTMLLLGLGLVGLAGLRRKE